MYDFSTATSYFLLVNQIIYLGLHTEWVLLLIGASPAAIQQRLSVPRAGGNCFGDGASIPPQ